MRFIEIQIQKNTTSEFQNINLETLVFGKTPTDHMFVAEYSDKTWKNFRIEPFKPLMISPFCLALHYGQTVFEGMKAYRMIDGNISVFRLKRHWERFNKSLRRMAMPEIPYEIFSDGIRTYLQVDEQWVVAGSDTSLYIRPFMFASEDMVRVKISEKYLFLVVGSPAKQYYAKPLNLFVETHYSRAAVGGTGSAKCGGNYGGSLYPTQLSTASGFDQVIWTDPIHHEYIEESGTMNIMFVIDGKLVTPELSDSILDGVTRDSILTIAKHLGIPAEERIVSVKELENDLKNGKVQESFGTGTAAIVAPVGSITIGETKYQLPTYDANSLMYKFKTFLSDIRIGKSKDIFGWNDIISVQNASKLM